MSERLYYTDSYLREFPAEVTGTSDDGLVLYLDRTAFYPTSGGQPFDLGTIGGVAVTEVADEEERIAHRVAAPVAAGPVECVIDWRRRFDHMQQHTGQHLISAVFEEMFGLKTVSFHMGADSSTIDLEGRAVDARVLAETELRSNQVIYENRPVAVQFEAAEEVQGLRKASGREGTLRIVSIAGLDRSACGGTHVRATGEIGAILLRKVEKVRQASRVEFLCGERAIRRARADYQALSRAAQLFSAPLDDVPQIVAAAQESARSSDKVRRKMELELAAYQGRELYQATDAAADGFRRVVRRAERGNMDDLRALAQSFTAQPKAVFTATLSDPPSILFAVSEDAGIDAGKLLKSALAANGGRGGGTPRMAQGSVPDAALLDAILGSLR